MRSIHVYISKKLPKCELLIRLSNLVRAVGLLSSYPELFYASAASWFIIVGITCMHVDTLAGSVHVATHARYLGLHVHKSLLLRRHGWRLGLGRHERDCWCRHRFVDHHRGVGLGKLSLLCGGIEGIRRRLSWLGGLISGDGWGVVGWTGW